MSTKQMQTSARLLAARSHFSQLCKLLGIFSPFAVQVGAGIHQRPTQLNTRVWLQSAEHRSKVLLSSESSTFGYVGPPQTKSICLSLTLRGKKRLSSISSVGSRPATPALPHLCAQDAVAEAGSHPPGHLCHPCPSRVTMITSRDGGSAASLVAPPASGHFHKRGNVSLGSGGISCVYACARSVSCPICGHRWAQPGYFSSVPGI